MCLGYLSGCFIHCDAHLFRPAIKKPLLIALSKHSRVRLQALHVCEGHVRGHTTRRRAQKGPRKSSGPDGRPEESHRRDTVPKTSKEKCSDSDGRAGLTKLHTESHPMHLLDLGEPGEADSGGREGSFCEEVSGKDISTGGGILNGRTYVRSMGGPGKMFGPSKKPTQSSLSNFCGGPGKERPTSLPLTES